MPCGEVRVRSVPSPASELVVSRPSALKRAWRVWIALGPAIGRVTTPVLLTVVFIAVIVPTRLVLALFGRDPLDARRAPREGSWWVVRTRRRTFAPEDFHGLG